MQRCIHQSLIERAEALVDKLRKGGQTVLTAESCTGGLVAACLSHGKEASSCLHGGFVVYTKTQKSEVLGVDDRLLREQGAVNAEVARQMAEGALRRSQASLCISVTGVIGPNADEDGNPPGLVYFGLALRGKPTLLVREEFSSLDPEGVRERTVMKALELLEGASGANPRQ